MGVDYHLGVLIIIAVYLSSFGSLKICPHHKHHFSLPAPYRAKARAWFCHSVIFFFASRVCFSSASVLLHGIVSDIAHSLLLVACRDMPGCARIFHDVPQYAAMCHNMPGNATMCQDVSRYATICNDAPGCVAMCHNVPQYATMCHELPDREPSLFFLPAPFLHTLNERPLVVLWNQPFSSCVF